MNDLIDKLRTLRKTHGYKQDFVGKYLGQTQAGYSKIESGEVKISIKQLKKLAELYNTSSEDILIWNGKISTNDIINFAALNKRIEIVEEKIEMMLFSQAK